MSEEIKMTEENKKTIVAFVAGLLIGGLLVFIFSAPTKESAMMKDQNDDHANGSGEMTDDDSMMQDDKMMEVEAGGGTGAPALVTGEGSIEVSDQTASDTVLLGSITFPADEGWIGVRDYEGGQLTGLLGVARWNKEEGLVPVVVPLLRSTEAGNTYAVVFYSDNGDKEFNLATDVQVDGSLSTFVAK